MFGEWIPPASNRAIGALVAVGILCSRLTGLVRQRVFAHYFGLQSDAADAFMAAFRIPNFLQNLFGEGALSASFIPVYASLLARGDRREATRVAGAVAALLALVTSVLVLLGVLSTPFLIAVIAPGFRGAKRDLTIAIVRVLFPGAGLLVLSAWCLGVLNSHHRFLLSYTAPVIWNVAMIAHARHLGCADPIARARAEAGVGIRGWQRAAVRRCSYRSSGGWSRTCGFASTSPNTFERSLVTLFLSLSAAASCKSARISTRCSRACCRPAPSPAWPTRSSSTRCR